MSVTVLGHPPFEKDENGRLRNRIATVFVKRRVLVTSERTHALQRIALTDRLDAEREAAGQPPLTPDETIEEWSDAVDLIVDDGRILIRPETDNMELAFEADQLLQDLVSKRNVLFLHAKNNQVQDALRRRGEYWRISPKPHTPDEILRMIRESRIAIGGEPIYYYNMMTGTRYLTCQEFAGLSRMTDEGLLAHLQEIARYGRVFNRGGEPEMAFFGVDDGFGRDVLSSRDFENLAPPEARAAHADIESRLRLATPAALRTDDPANTVWRNEMFRRLSSLQHDTVADVFLPQLTPEFFMQIRWLPGARIEEGELVFDPVFDEFERNPADPSLAELCDERVHGFICNYVREFGNLEYINIGRVAPTLRRHIDTGMHQAYIAELKHRRDPKPLVRIIRLQKWGIHHHLDSLKGLLDAVMQSEEYTEFILDRRLGCWQMGMSLPPNIITRRIAETYRGRDPKYHGYRIWTTYFERPYIEGMATDKIPAVLFENVTFAQEFARLLGRAAASNMIVGRVTRENMIMFDDGDEVLVLDAEGRPQEIIVADHAGTFTDCESPLTAFAAAYARPVLGRARHLASPRDFADIYLNALSGRLAQIQRDYRRRRRAFDTLFKYSKQGEGAFAWRWTRMLERLDRTEAPEVYQAIRQVIDAGLKPPSG